MKKCAYCETPEFNDVRKCSLCGCEFFHPISFSFDTFRFVLRWALEDFIWSTDKNTMYPNRPKLSDYGILIPDYYQTVFYEPPKSVILLANLLDKLERKKSCP